MCRIELGAALDIGIRAFGCAIGQALGVVSSVQFGHGWGAASKEKCQQNSRFHWGKNNLEDARAEGVQHHDWRNHRNRMIAINKRAVRIVLVLVRQIFV